MKFINKAGTCNRYLLPEIDYLDPQKPVQSKNPDLRVTWPAGFPWIYLFWPTGYPDSCPALLGIKPQLSSLQSTALSVLPLHQMPMWPGGGNISTISPDKKLEWFKQREWTEDDEVAWGLQASYWLVQQLLLSHITETTSYICIFISASTADWAASFLHFRSI